MDIWYSVGRGAGGVRHKIAGAASFPAEEWEADTVAERVAEAVHSCGTTWPRTGRLTIWLYGSADPQVKPQWCCHVTLELEPSFNVETMRPDDYEEDE
jgi:hypothetical protein